MSDSLLDVRNKKSTKNLDKTLADLPKCTPSSSLSILTISSSSCTPNSVCELSSYSVTPPLSAASISSDSVYSMYSNSNSNLNSNSNSTTSCSQMQKSPSMPQFDVNAQTPQSLQNIQNIQGVQTMQKIQNKQHSKRKTSLPSKSFGKPPLNRSLTEGADSKGLVKITTLPDSIPSSPNYVSFPPFISSSYPDQNDPTSPLTKNPSKEDKEKSRVFSWTSLFSVTGH